MLQVQTATDGRNPAVETPTARARKGSSRIPKPIKPIFYSNSNPNPNFNPSSNPNLDPLPECASGCARLEPFDRATLSTFKRQSIHTKHSFELLRKPDLDPKPAHKPDRGPDHDTDPDPSCHPSCDRDRDSDGDCDSDGDSDRDPSC